MKKKRHHHFSLLIINSKLLNIYHIYNILILIRIEIFILSKNKNFNNATTKKTPLNK